LRVFVVERSFLHEGMTIYCLKAIDEIVCIVGKEHDSPQKSCKTTVFYSFVS
jgi:hypothetical protein